MSISYMGEGNLKPEEQKALEAYRKALHTITLERGRKTKPWKLAQHAALRKLLLNGTCLIFRSPEVNAPKVIKHLAIDAQNPAKQAKGKRRVYKENKK